MLLRLAEKRFTKHPPAGQRACARTPRHRAAAPVSPIGLLGSTLCLHAPVAMYPESLLDYYQEIQLESDKPAAAAAWPVAVPALAPAPIPPKALREPGGAAAVPPRRPRPSSKLLRLRSLSYLCIPSPDRLSPLLPSAMRTAPTETFLPRKPAMLPLTQSSAPPFPRGPVPPSASAATAATATAAAGSPAASPRTSSTLSRGLSISLGPDDVYAAYYTALIEGLRTGGLLHQLAPDALPLPLRTAAESDSDLDEAVKVLLATLARHYPRIGRRWAGAVRVEGDFRAWVAAVDELIGDE